MYPFSLRSCHSRIVREHDPLQGNILHCLKRTHSSKALSASSSSNISPLYISGLTQADGTFCTLLKKSSGPHKITTVPVFSITLDLDSINTLYSIQNYFKCGRIYINEKKNSGDFVVSTISELQSIIIPHFLNYPIHGAKQQAFKILISIVELINNKENKNPQGIANIIQLASLMNKSTQRTEIKINQLYELIGIKPLINSPNLPSIEEVPLLDEFIIGLLDGDGSFYVSFTQKKTIRFGFNIVGSIEYLDLFNNIKNFLNCGTVKSKSPTVIRYDLESIKAIRTILIPFVDKYTLHTSKHVHYNLFKEVLSLYDKGVHKNNEGFKEILKLAYNMNKGGKRRRISLEEYINKYD